MLRLCLDLEWGRNVGLAKGPFCQVESTDLDQLDYDGLSKMIRPYHGGGCASSRSGDAIPARVEYGFNPMMMSKKCTQTHPILAKWTFIVSLSFPLNAL